MEELYGNAQKRYKNKRLLKVIFKKKYKFCITVMQRFQGGGG